MLNLAMTRHVSQFLLPKKIKKIKEHGPRDSFRDEKKIKKLIKSKKQKKITEKTNHEKKNILKFLNNRPVWFQFYKLETEKNKPNRTQTEKNPSQTGKKSSQTEKPSQIRKN
jgi:hypothetical protein